MSGIDLHDPAKRKVLMDSAVEAAAAFLNAAVGGAEPVLFGKLWCDLVIRESRLCSPRTADSTMTWCGN